MRIQNIPRLRLGSSVLRRTHELRQFCMHILLSCVCVTTMMHGVAYSQSAEAAETVRLATFNCSLNRSEAGELLRDLKDDQNEPARNVARIIRQVRPHILLLNEFDYEPESASVRLFQQHYLESNSDWCEAAPVHFPYHCCLPVNTGVDSNCDLNHNGMLQDPADAQGFGRFPGQYGMVLLSRFPIQAESVRSFQKLLWSSMPAASLPQDPDTKVSWYTDRELRVIRLSSKSHWDVPVSVNGSTLHVLASHPTPPAFDGPEDRNGRRNHDEIRFWADYLDTKRSDWIADDEGGTGGLAASAHFAILGDLNSDPMDGDSFQNAIRQLLDHPRVNATFVPRSDGAGPASVTQGKVNDAHAGPPESDTADFSDSSVGNLRVDYVLPSGTLQIQGGGVFWPVPEDPRAAWIKCSDHRLVWLDVELPRSPPAPVQ